jgi:hypothetical protein
MTSHTTKSIFHLGLAALQVLGSMVAIAPFQLAQARTVGSCSEAQGYERYHLQCDQIVVTGTAGLDPTVPFMSWLWIDDQWQWSYTTVANKLAEKFTEDVRCYAGNASRSTSCDDADPLWGIANNMYRASAVANPVKRGGEFTVTWADGGSTTYRVVGGATSGLPLSSVVISHTKGDCVVKPAPNGCKASA